MVYGELCRYPLDIDDKLKIVSYWCVLVSATSKLSYIYTLLKHYFIDFGNKDIYIFTVYDNCTFFVSKV